MENKEFYKENKQLLKLRSSFRRTANIIDELLELNQRESNGEDVENEMEDVIARLTFEAVQLAIWGKLI